MAITPNTYNSVVFGGINSADYGIYITGEAVYNAPVRAVDFVSVPGRNGAVALDQGHYENVTVTYPAGTFGDDQQDFRETLSDYRNAILSQIGYQRLSDTYHPDEYRLGIYADGLEVKPTIKQQGTAGEFDLVFNCKPQRYLTSGETSISVTSGDTVTNPTAFGSEPLLAIEGKGRVTFNGFAINLIDQDLGNVMLAEVKDNERSTGGVTTGDILVHTSWVENGNIATIDSALLQFRTSLDISSSSLSITASSGAITGVTVDRNGMTNDIVLKIPTQTVAFTGSTNTVTGSVTVSIFNKNTHTTNTVDVTLNLITTYSSIYRRIHMDATITPSGFTYSKWKAAIYNVSVYSTATALGHPTYIDCEIGEAYKYMDSELVVINGLIDFGSDLPTLAPGANVVTYDNTITALDITPRWWKI